MRFPPVAAVAALVLLATVPAAAPAAAPALEAENLARLRAMFPHAPPADLAAIAHLAARRGLALGDAPATSDGAVPEVHVGEVWGVCMDSSSWWVYPPPDTYPDCHATDVTRTGVPCTVVAAHWALWAYGPHAIGWSLGAGGNPWRSWDAFFTEGHAGLGHVERDHRAHKFTGSGCVFTHYESYHENYAIGFGDGVAVF